MEKNEFWELIGSLQHFELVTTVDDKPTDSDDGDWRITSHSQVKSYEEFPAFGSGVRSVIYPGALVKGEIATKNTPEAVVASRSSGTIFRMDGARKDIPDMNRAAINDAIVTILKEDSESIIPADFVFDDHEVESKQQLAFSIGVNYDYMQSVNIDASFSIDASASYNHQLVSLAQKFYSLEFVRPEDPFSLFGEETSIQDLKRNIGDYVPAYVSSVAYGRRFLLLMTTTSSKLELKAAVNASFAKGAANADANAVSQLSDFQVNVVAYGGLADKTMAGSRHADLGAIVDMLAKSADIQTGLPLSYRLNSVKDNSLVNFGLRGSYETRSRVPKVPVRKNSRIRLQGPDGRYISPGATQWNWSYYYPTLQSNFSGADLFQMGGGQEILNHGNNIPLITTSTSNWNSSWQASNRLGAFQDKHQLYYWGDYGQKSNWVIEMANGRNEEIGYGDQVTIKNDSYNQYLAPARNNYLTTTTEKYTWTILQ